MAWKKILLEGDALEMPAGSTKGDLLYFDGTSWTRLPKGTDGQVLKSTLDDVAWSNITTTDELVKADANDTTAGYLSDKVDGTTIVEDSTNHNIKVGTIKSVNIDVDADIEANYHSLTHLVIENVQSNPTSGNEVEGQIVYNSADKHPYIYTP